VFLDQADFPGPIPFLEPFFAPDRIFRIIKLFEVNQPHDIVFLGEALYYFQAMFCATRRIRSFVTPM
jgi:hypothetical protein